MDIGDGNLQAISKSVRHNRTNRTRVQMRKGLKMEPHDLSLKREGMPQRNLMEWPCVNSTRGQWDKGTQEISSAGQLLHL